jgi:hypothetical protein
LKDLKRSTQTLLYHLLPVVFWLLAIGGSLVPLLPAFTFHLSPFTYLMGYTVALIALICVAIISRIKRHTSSVEECFQVALLLGIAAYWLPSVVFLIIPIWFYLVYQNLFSLRSLFASLIGFAVVAIWYAVFYYLSIFTFPLSLSANLYAWISTGAFLIAWLGTTIVRRNLRVR